MEGILKLLDKLLSFYIEKKKLELEKNKDDNEFKLKSIKQLKKSKHKTVETILCKLNIENSENDFLSKIKKWLTLISSLLP